VLHGKLDQCGQPSFLATVSYLPYAKQ
jgi:hypothetical protein